MSLRQAVKIMSPVVCLLVLAAPHMVVGCKSDSPKKGPKVGAVASPSPTPTADVSPLISSSPTPITSPDISAGALNILPVDAALQFPAGQAVRASFTVTGSALGEVRVGLAQAPAGTLLEGASSRSPIFVWNVPVQGVQSVKFILRDMSKCMAVENSADTCDLSTNVVESPKSYDVVSQVFAITVGTGSGNKPTLATILPLIIQLVASGASGGLDLQAVIGLLSTLSSGQLQTVLTQLQSGGSLQTILSQLGLGLTEGAPDNGG